MKNVDITQYDCLCGTTLCQCRLRDLCVYNIAYI